MNQTSNIEFINNCTPSYYRALGVTIDEKSNCCLVASGAKTPFLNGVVSLSIKNSQVEETVEKVFKYYEEKKLSYSWWTEVSKEPSGLRGALEKRGMNLQGVFPGQILLMDDIITPKNSKDLVIEQVADKDGLISWSNVISKVFGFSEDAFNTFATLIKSAGINGPSYHLIGKKDKEVVCVGSVYCTEQGAYISNIATVEHERNHGYGSNITYALIKLAKSQNMSRIALLSSPQATSVYQKLGFKKKIDYHIYC